MTSEADDEALIYLGLEDALEIYAAIFDLDTEQAADHLRSRDALTLLKVNGYELSATDPELAAWIINFSSGATPEQIADQIRTRIQRIT